MRTKDVVRPMARSRRPFRHFSTDWRHSRGFIAAGIPKGPNVLTLRGHWAMAAAALPNLQVAPGKLKHDWFAPEIRVADPPGQNRE